MRIIIKVPSLGESITEVTVAQWIKKQGDYIEMDEVICELESDKATFELSAEAAGILYPKAKEGDTLEIGAVVCEIDTAVKANKQPQQTAYPPPTPTQREEKSTDGVIQQQVLPQQSPVQGSPSPLASKILLKRGIDPQYVQGTGVGGRITKNDALKAENSTLQSSEERGKAIPDKSIGKPPRIQRREKRSTIRTTIARRFVEAKNETAMFTIFNEVNMESVMTLRKRYQAAFKEKYKVDLGFISFFTKAVCVALQAWPTVNARIDGDEIVYHDFCDVALTISTPHGLVAPVIRNAESLTFGQLEKEVEKLATKAKDNKLSRGEMAGGTFTIANSGIFGTMLSTPMINIPQSAILGIYHIVERPVAINGQVVIKPIMYIALSYDHRLIDSRESMSFLDDVKRLIEDPIGLLLGI